METSVNWMNSLCPVLKQMSINYQKANELVFIATKRRHSCGQPLRLRTTDYGPSTATHMQFKRFIIIIIGQLLARFSSALGQFLMYHMICYLRFVNNNNLDRVKWIFWFGVATVTNATLFTIVAFGLFLFFFFFINLNLKW